jgi:hypothetical protein
LPLLIAAPLPRTADGLGVAVPTAFISCVGGSDGLRGGRVHTSLVGKGLLGLRSIGIEPDERDSEERTCAGMRA